MMHGTYNVKQIKSPSASPHTAVVIYRQVDQTELLKRRVVVGTQKVGDVLSFASVSVQSQAD